MKTENLAIKDIENLFHPATNLVVHEDSEPLILNKGEGIYVYDAVSYTHPDAADD